jgi:hypothetical protein
VLDAGESGEQPFPPSFLPGDRLKSEVGPLIAKEFYLANQCGEYLLREREKAILHQEILR